MWRILGFLYFLSCHCDAEQNSLKVSIYYETLCPDSKAFIKNQLYPTYKALRDDSVMQLDFVPYGHASETNETGDWQFTCQHGPKECFGNGFHACALAVEPSQDLVTDFIYCSMIAEEPSNPDTLLQCAQKTGVSFTDILDCYFNGDYIDLLIENGVRTRAVEDTSFIPTIVLNDEFDKSNQDKSLTDFKELVCDTLGNEPEGCK